MADDNHGEGPSRPRGPKPGGPSRPTAAKPGPFEAAGKAAREYHLRHVEGLRRAPRRGDGESDSEDEDRGGPMGHETAEGDEYRHRDAEADHTINLDKHLGRVVEDNPELKDILDMLITMLEPIRHKEDRTPNIDNLLSSVQDVIWEQGPASFFTGDTSAEDADFLAMWLRDQIRDLDNQELWATFRRTRKK